MTHVIYDPTKNVVPVWDLLVAMHVVLLKVKAILQTFVSRCVCYCAYNIINDCRDYHDDRDRYTYGEIQTKYKCCSFYWGYGHNSEDQLECCDGYEHNFTNCYCCIGSVFSLWYRNICYLKCC